MGDGNLPVPSPRLGNRQIMPTRIVVNSSLDYRRSYGVQTKDLLIAFLAFKNPFRSHTLLQSKRFGGVEK
jgi:hypothetical protein